METQARLIFITGVMAAGKSTVAEALARRLPKAVHLRGDLFRRMIVSGRVDMSVEPSHDALEQLRLRYALARVAALAYLEAGFDVVYQDVVLGEMLAEVVAALRGQRLHVVVLCPSAEVVAQRELGRNKVGYTGVTVEQLNKLLLRQTPRVGFWLDNSEMTVEGTVDAITANLAVAACGAD